MNSLEQEKKKKLDEVAKKYSHINFKPTKSIAAAAARGLEYRKKAGGKGGLSGKQAKKHGIGSGVQRAVNLKNRDTMSPGTVRARSLTRIEDMLPGCCGVEILATPGHARLCARWMQPTRRISNEDQAWAAQSFDPRGQEAPTLRLVARH